MGSSNILNQMRWSYKVSNSPASSIECLSNGAYSQGTVVKFRRECGDAREWDVVEAFVDLIRENNDVVLDSQLTNILEFSTGKNLTDRVVTVLLV